MGPLAYLVRAPSLWLLVLLLLPALPAGSQEEVETPSMRRQSILWSPSAVTVITKDEIRTSGANEFHELLRRVPGMDVFDDHGVDRAVQVLARGVASSLCQADSSEPRCGLSGDEALEQVSIEYVVRLLPAVLGQAKHRQVSSDDAYA